MRIAPWNDYKGNIVYEGDTIVHPVDPEYDRGVVEFWPHENGPHAQWRVRYTNGSVLALFLQITWKGQAVVERHEQR